MPAEEKKLIEGHTQAHLLGVAEGVVKKKTAASVVLDREAEGRIPKFRETGAYVVTVRIHTSP